MTKSQETTERMKALRMKREKALEEEKFDKGAASVKGIYDAYIKAGFTEKQAWELLTISMENALKGGF